MSLGCNKVLFNPEENNGGLAQLYLNCYEDNTCQTFYKGGQPNPAPAEGVTTQALQACARNIGNFELKVPSPNALTPCVVVDAWWPFLRHNLSQMQRWLPQEAITKENESKHRLYVIQKMKTDPLYMKLPLVVLSPECNPQPRVTNSQRGEVDPMQVTHKADVGDAFKSSPRETVMISRVPTVARNRR